MNGEKRTTSPLDTKLSFNCVWPHKVEPWFWVDILSPVYTGILIRFVIRIRQLTFYWNPG